MKVNLTSPLEPSECVRRLAALTDQTWLSMGVQPISGKVLSDRFSWRKHSGMQAKWQPVLRAQLTARPGGGTAIAGRIAPKLWVTIVLTIALSLILVPAFYIVISSTMSDGLLVSTLVKLFALSVFPLAVLVAFVFLARRTWTNESAFLLGLLASTLEISGDAGGDYSKVPGLPRIFVP